jgi:hypothetical protein
MLVVRYYVQYNDDAVFATQNPTGNVHEKPGPGSFLAGPDDGVFLRAE